MRSPGLSRRRSDWWRRFLFQVHLWSGLALALYVTAVGVSGAILVFSRELEALEYPALFAPSNADGPLADPALVLATVRRAYPDHRVSSVNWPAPWRNAFVSYPSRPGDTRTVFVHPTSGAVLGELPRHGFVRTVRDIHVYLLAGGTGLKVNGVAAACLLALIATGLVVWWPLTGRWVRALLVDWRRGWKRVTWELHGAAGVWCTALLLMWCVSGVYLTFPDAFRSAVAKLSPLAARNAPSSSPPVMAGTTAPPRMDALIARAREAVPGGRPVRYTEGSAATGSLVVVMTRGVPGDRLTSQEVWVHYDKYDGRLLGIRPQAGTTAGDWLMAWLFPLHAGWFGGQAIKVFWAALAISFPLLSISGVVMWWNRVVTPRRVRRRSSGPPAAHRTTC